jgi:methyltransferase (TIGR00027 family)
MNVETSEQPTTGASLGATAHWAAAVRALESKREDALFKDPWAAALAGEPGEAWIAQRSPESVVPMILRTRYFDDFLKRISQQEGLRQIVLVAAGLDTRAFRLAWPAKTRFFELDQPEVLAYKEQVLLAAGAKPACERQIVAVDLTGDWQERLNECGFDRQQPSGWLLEGLLFYLSDSHIRELLNNISNLAAPGSWIGFDIINSSVLTSPLTQKWVAMQAASGAPWIGSMDDPAGFLAGHGWSASLSQAGAPEANFGRWLLPVIPVLMPNMPHNWFVTAYKE